MPYSKFKGPFLYRRSQGFVDYILSISKFIQFQKRATTIMSGVDIRMSNVISCK